MSAECLLDGERIECARSARASARPRRSDQDVSADRLRDSRTSAGRVLCVWCEV